MAPVPENDLMKFVNGLIDSNNVMIFSKTTCPFCTRVKELFKSLKVEFHALEIDKLDNCNAIQQTLGAKIGRSTVPQVFIKSQHVGGCDDTMAANADGRLAKLLNPADTKEESPYEYDLVVIGGGSGGLAASKEAAQLGKRVAVFDFVKPTPKGTSWGLGGTCVNVGCIPKKLMHQAGILGHLMEDAKKFGWQLPETMQHNWDVMKEAIQNYIGSLNWGYRVALREKTVQYINSYATFVDAHTVKGVDKRGKEKLVTADKFIIATGERPRYMDIPGAKELAITSDDLFSLPYCPGKTLVVGASYVALECAGFLASLGMEVTIMVRSILLRGFDQDMAERIGEYMALHGVTFRRPCLPLKFEEIVAGQPGMIKVTSRMTETGEILEEEYNTVLLAIGRDACTSGIGLETVGVKVNEKNGKIPAVNEQTNVENIYAIGDILEGKLELTPVAIEAGTLLARRLYGGSNIQCDYINVATTVFTPLEYGSIGYSEEAAIEKFGESNIEIYHTSLTPLEWTVPKREENLCYVKIICLIPENEKIIGFHYLGPNAGEVTQGYALGIKKGATKADLDATIGIHPTCSEIFTTLSVTKRSGASIKQKGC